MSIVSTTSALQDLWSIVLSRHGANNEALSSGRVRASGAAKSKIASIPAHLSSGQAYTIVKQGIPSRSLTPLSAHPMLDGESPLECAKSGFGAQRVKDILVAIRYGGVV